jgi:glycosyltransferase involved in cell wall biosynthesis
MHWRSRLIRSAVGKFCFAKAGEFYDHFVCTAEAVRRQAKLGQEDKAARGLKFSVGIPHYNRGRLIYRPLFNLLNHPAVAEVIIVDDGSREEEFRKLRDFVESLGCGDRVKVFRRQENKGALLTKLECVEKCSSEWVLVLDSDNTAFSRYLDKLGGIRNPNPQAFYCANWAFPFFPFHDFSGLKFDFDKACEWTRTGILKQVYIFNDGNYLVNRQTYMEIVGGIGRIASDVADVMVVNYRWISEGGGLSVLPNASYFHRVDASSFWNLTAEQSKSRVMCIYAALEDGRRFENWICLNSV